MKKKILSIFIMIGLVASLAACGNNGKETETASTEVVQKDALEEAAEEPVASGNRESEEKSKEETVSDVKGEVEYTEQRDIFVVKQIDTGDGSEIDLSKQETINGPFVFTESIDIYSYYFTYAGYTKPDIEVHSVGACADNSAQSACTEFKIAVESVCNSVGVSCNGFKLGLKIGIVGGFFAPKGVSPLFWIPVFM